MSYPIIYVHPRIDAFTVVVIQKNYIKISQPLKFTPGYTKLSVKVKTTFLKTDLYVQQQTTKPYLLPIFTVTSVSDLNRNVLTMYVFRDRGARGARAVGGAGSCCWGERRTRNMLASIKGFWKVCRYGDLYMVTYIFANINKSILLLILSHLE